MKSKKMVFGIMLFLFILINIYSIQNVFTIENPDYTFEINPNDYSYIKFYSLDVFDQLNVEVEVIAGGNNLIDVYLVDSANFQEYQGGQSSFAKVVHQGVSYINFDYTITYLDDYYLILSNPAVFIYVKTVEVKTTIVEAEKSIQIDYPVYSTIFYIEEDDYYNNCPIQWETTGDIEEAISLVKKYNKNWEPETPTRKNLAKKIANNIFGNIPVIWASGTLGEVARRWKCQINENAKNSAFFETLPELNHNTISDLDFPKPKNLYVLILQSKYYHP